MLKRLVKCGRVKIAYSKVENMGNLMGVYPVENPTWQAGFSPANSMEKSTN
jgi:hypothetical protein